MAARPKTLPAAVAPVAMGVALAWKFTATISWWLACCTLLSTVAIQVATNFFNDAIDAAKGADTVQRLGPTRATATGLASSRAMFIAAGLAILLAAAFGWPLIQARGWIMLAIGIPSLYFSYGYTGGRWPLAYRGLGDLFVLLFFGLIAVTGTVYVQLGQWRWEAVVAGMQVGMLSTVLIAINNLRDVEEDRLSGKRTLAVCFGKTFGRLEITLLNLLPYGIGAAVWPGLGWGRVAWWPLSAAVLGGILVVEIWRTEPSRAYNKYLAVAGLQLILFAMLWVAAMF